MDLELKIDGRPWMLTPDADTVWELLLSALWTLSLKF